MIFEKLNPALFSRVGAVICNAAMAAAVAGCGGSDGPDVHTSVDGPLTVAEAVGNYSTGCVKREGSGSQYKIVTGTFSDLNNGSGNAVVQYKVFGSDAACKDASLVFHVTAGFDVSPVLATKNIAAGTLQNPLTGTASVAEATLRSLTLSKGTFTGRLPTLGFTTKVGYLLNKPSLHFLAGPRDADGLGRYISSLELKKI